MTDRTAELEAALAAILRPLAKCEPPEPMTDEVREILAAKREFSDELDRLGLNERQAARLLQKSPSTIVGWCDPRDRKRYPPKHVFRLLARRVGSERGREVLLREAKSSVDAASILSSDDAEKTGTYA